MKDPGPEAVQLTLVPMKAAGTHPFRQLARILKALKRAYGWRCVSVGPASMKAASLDLLQEMPAVAQAAAEEEAP
jgi:hypothetical protein